MQTLEIVSDIPVDEWVSIRDLSFNDKYFIYPTLDGTFYGIEHGDPGLSTAKIKSVRVSLLPDRTYALDTDVDVELKRWLIKMEVCV